MINRRLESAYVVSRFSPTINIAVYMCFGATLMFVS